MRLPDGHEVSTASFLRIDADAVTREFLWNESSVEDWLYTTALLIEDHCLKSCFRGERYGGGGTCSLSVVADPDEAALRAIADSHAEHCRTQTMEDARDRSFPS